MQRVIPRIVFTRTRSWPLINLLPIQEQFSRQYFQYSHRTFTTDTPNMAGTLGHLVVEETNPTRTHLVPCDERGLDQPPLGEGQVRVHISKLVVTANTVTYALAGKNKVLRYFDHFAVPEGAPSGVAMSPCWGHGVVMDSKVASVPVGTRIHGYYPFSPTVDLSLKPESSKSSSPTSFVDMTPRRKDLIAPYKVYWTHDDPLWKGQSYDDEDYTLSTGFLFGTGWAMAQTAAIHPDKPTALLLTSASSRTSRAAAFAAKFHKMPLKVLGLTSESRVDYVKSLGLYDEVQAYGNEDALPKGTVVVQDVAGRWQLLQ